MFKQTILSRHSLDIKVTILCLIFGHALALLPAQLGIADRVYAAITDRPLYKSTWLWDSNSLLQNKDTTLQFLQQNGVNLVFLQIDPDISQNEYSTFIREATNLGIEVHALGGAPDWILRENQIKVYKLIDWVKTYNSNVLSQEQFRGIHLDVEPFVLPEWYADTDTMLGLWRDTMSGFVEQMKIDTPNLIAGADLPTWLEKFNVPDGQGGRTTLSNWMIRQLDQITLMAYRDNAANISSSITTELDEAEKNGKSIIVAVETLQSSEGPITFYEKGRSQMMKELDAVADTLKNRAPFVGFAIHDYVGWSSLKD